MVLEMAHATGPVKVVANPVKLSATPADYPLPPPTLGQHTEAVLGGLLGIEAGRLADLRARGII
jgi:crotonobetainyl-CoA:carnitine CoA-transferase CaiB-like acyl-CoA transferase